MEDLAEYRKSIVALVSAVGVLVSLVVGSLTGSKDAAIAVAGVFAAAGPVLVFWFPNAPQRGPVNDPLND